MPFLSRLVAHPLGALAALILAAFLEAYGDSCFQTGFYRSTGPARAIALVGGVAVLGIYGSVVNAPRWDFGRLIGVYVACFFLVAQILNRLRYGHAPTPPIYAGGSLILAGGLLMAFWRG